MQKLVPIGTFENRARELLGDSEFEALLELLAKSPRVGRVIQSTGGLRKVRIARKSSGTRVIYYYHNESKPILLLLIYAKADQDSLTAKQKQVLRKLVEEIIDELR